MTWTLSAQGHHQSSDWKQEEIDLLRALVQAFEANEDNVTSIFKFSGNHIAATSLQDAKDQLDFMDPK